MKRVKRTVIKRKPEYFPRYVDWGCTATFSVANNVHRFVLRKKLPLLLQEIAKRENQTIYYYDKSEPHTNKEEGFLLNVTITGVSDRSPDI